MEAEQLSQGTEDESGEIEEQMENERPATTQSIEERQPKGKKGLRLAAKKLFRGYWYLYHWLSAEVCIKSSGRQTVYVLLPPKQAIHGDRTAKESGKRTHIPVFKVKIFARRYYDK